MQKIIGLISIFVLFGSIIIVGIKGYKYSIAIDGTKFIAFRRAINWGGFTFLIILIEIMIFARLSIKPPSIYIVITISFTAFVLIKWLPVYSTKKSEYPDNKRKVTEIGNENHAINSKKSTGSDPLTNAAISTIQNNVHETKQMQPSEIYSMAINELENENISQSKTHFNKLIDSFPNTEEALKAKLHLMKMLQKKSNIPSVVYILPLIIGNFLRHTPKLLAQSLPVLLFGSIIMLSWWAWISWKNFAIDDAESKVKNASGWLGFLAILNIGIGLLLKFEIFSPPYPIDSDYLLLFGIGFLIITPIIYLLRNILTVCALLFAIAAWGIDTILIAWDIIVSNFSVEPSMYISLVLHSIILSIIYGALGALNGLFKLQAQSEILNRSQDNVL